MTFDINAYLAQQTPETFKEAESGPIVDLRTMPTVTNSGFYRFDVQNAFLRTNTAGAYVELDGVATLESDPAHTGALRLFVNLPTGDANEYPSVGRRFSGMVWACKSLNANGHPFLQQEERTTKDGLRTFIVCPTLEGKTIYVWCTSYVAKNGRAGLRPYAFFDDHKRSAWEAQNNLPAAQYNEITNIRSEGKPLGPSQAEQSNVQAQNAFAAPVSAANAYQANVYQAQQANAYQTQAAAINTANPYGLPSPQEARQQVQQAQAFATAPNPYGAPQQSPFGNPSGVATTVEHGGNGDDIPF